MSMSVRTNGLSIPHNLTLGEVSDAKINYTGRGHLDTTESPRASESGKGTSTQRHSVACSRGS